MWKPLQAPSLSDSWMRISFLRLEWASAVPSVATFLAVMLFDCSACLIGLSQQARLIHAAGDPVPGEGVDVSSVGCRGLGSSGSRSR